ncbi:hypothetical protein HF324_27580 [Chitinophaga oryzae]|uniref:Uncharacterized protein n=1 Tax=Chitinophaga oryzae TaxID=2725414 RepID=A0AAE6ZKU9_9BACT|nr:hypothetical protein [Chitinophaga oryzae]QJB34886.1 hypothetical protein HF329_27720 [Chitinophaga oryzae]QJB41397.1 hypothetical protein HF324_27580 [Chitinophaga oryzae]
MIKEQETIYNLLKKIHEFYPVGMKSFVGYPGANTIAEIIEKKINTMIAGERTAISALLDSIRISAGDYEIVDYSAGQFPCYSIGVFIEEDTSGDLNRRTLIMFTISLLCNYYTYYIHDFFRVSGQTTISQRRKVYPIDSVSLENHLSFGNMKTLIDKISRATQQFFPEYMYVNHYQLFSNYVTGAVPFGKTEDGNVTSSHSIYHFLFDSFFSENLIVMP